MNRDKHRPKRKCGECLKCNTSAYGRPVCYEIERRDDKPVAVMISASSTKAHTCYYFKAKEDLKDAM